MPIGSMYGIFTYIYHKNQPNVGEYTIHGSYEIGNCFFLLGYVFVCWVGPVGIWHCQRCFRYDMFVWNEFL